jgi:hypothetical protein
MARAMAKDHGGDWRDLGAVRGWGERLGAELAGMAPRRIPAAPVQPHVRERVRRALATLCLFTGVTAVAGGLALFGWPKGGGEYGPPLSLLDPTPFRDFLIPGLLLFVFVGLTNLAAWVMVLRRHPFSEIAAFGGGGALTVWILVEMVMLRTAHWLQWLYLAIGVATMAAALWLWLKRPAAARQWRLIEAR